jgi:hypothetical protein
LNSGVNDLRGRGFLRSVVSILDILSGAVPLMVDVRQTGESPRDDLVVECRSPQMWVVDEASGEVRAVVAKSIRARRAPDTRNSFAVQVRANRLAVTLEMAGDGRDGPSPLEQSICFHVFSH